MHSVLLQHNASCRPAALFWPIFATNMLQVLTFRSIGPRRVPNCWALWLVSPAAQSAGELQCRQGDRALSAEQRATVALQCKGSPYGTPICRCSCTALQAPRTDSLRVGLALFDLLFTHLDWQPANNWNVLHRRGHLLHGSHLHGHNHAVVLRMLCCHTQRS